MFTYQQSQRRRNHSPGEKGSEEYEKSLNLHQLNKALEFTTKYIELESQYKLNFLLVNANLTINPDMIKNEDDAKSRKNPNYGYNDGIKTTAAARQLVIKHHYTDHYIDLIELVKDKSLNVERPSNLFKRAAQPSKMPTISLVHSQLISKDLDPIDEINSLQNQNSQNQSLEEARIYNDSRSPYEIEESSPADKVSYTISQKKYAKRYWQEKFQPKPDIPVKVVTFRKQTSQSPVRESQRKSPLKLSDTQKSSPKGIKLDTSKKILEDKNYDDDGSTQMGSADSGDNFYKSLPYFNSPFTRSSRNLDGRSHSPVLFKDTNLKDLIDSELLMISNSRTSSSKTPLYQESHQGIVALTGETSPLSRSTAKLSTSKMAPSQQKVSAKPKVTDASQRFRMPTSPKSSRAPLYKQESENLKQSLRSLKQMFD